jgi:hypothetical protein
VSASDNKDLKKKKSEFAVSKIISIAKIVFFIIMDKE